jgi:hypothetical protein
VSIQPPSNTTLYSYGTNIIRYNSSGKAQWVADISGVNIGFYGLQTDGTNLYGFGGYLNPGFGPGIPIFINSDKTITVVSRITGGLNNNGTYFVKYNSAGIAQWTNNVENFSNQTNTGGMVSDGTYSYVTGYGVAVTIYNLDGTVFKTYVSSGYFDGYLIQYDTSGNPQWGSTISYSGNGGCFPTQVVLSSSGIYVIGNFGMFGAGGTSIISFNNKDDVPQFTLSTDAYHCMFVAKYNTSGTPLWATKVEYGDGSNGYFGRVYGTSIAIDSAAPNSIYALAWYGIYNPEFGPFPINVYSEGDQTTPTKQVYGWNVFYGQAMILVKYDADGNVIWATNIRSPNGDPYSSNINPYALTVSSGFIYIVGSAYYANVATYDPTNATTNPATGTQTQTGGTMIWSSGLPTGILIAYNTDGIPQWKTQIVGTYPFSDSNLGAPATSVTTGGGNIYVSGFTDTLGPPPLVTFYNTPDGTVNSKFTLTNTAVINNFTVAYNTQGKVLWVNNTSAPGTNGTGINGLMAYTNVLYVSSPGSGVAT